METADEGRSPEAPLAPPAGALAADDETAVDMTVAVYAAPDGITAELVRGALQDAGINAVIGEQVADAYAGALALGEGYWGEVRVPPGDVGRARTVLDAFEAGQGAATDADLSARSVSPGDTSEQE